MVDIEQLMKQRESADAMIKPSVPVGCSPSIADEQELREFANHNHLTSCESYEKDEEDVKSTQDILEKIRKSMNRSHCDSQLENIKYQLELIPEKSHNKENEGEMTHDSKDDFKMTYFQKLKTQLDSNQFA